VTVEARFLDRAAIRCETTLDSVGFLGLGSRAKPGESTLATELAGLENEFADGRRERDSVSGLFAASGPESGSTSRGDPLLDPALEVLQLRSREAGLSSNPGTSTIEDGIPSFVVRALGEIPEDFSWSSRTVTYLRSSSYF
jgi:hypothetical protein